MVRQWWIVRYFKLSIVYKKTRLKRVSPSASWRTLQQKVFTYQELLYKSGVALSTPVSAGCCLLVRNCSLVGFAGEEPYLPLALIVPPNLFLPFQA